MELLPPINPLKTGKSSRTSPWLSPVPAVRNRRTTHDNARELAATGKVDIFRAGIWKPRTRPNSFEGDRF